MNLLNTLRQRLGWKLFLSNLVIVLVGVIVLAGTAKLHAPTALSRHTARMQALLGNDPALTADLHDNFMAAVNEILAVASPWLPCWQRPSSAASLPDASWDRCDR